MKKLFIILLFGILFSANAQQEYVTSSKLGSHNNSVYFTQIQLDESKSLNEYNFELKDNSLSSINAKLPINTGLIFALSDVEIMKDLDSKSGLNVKIVGLSNGQIVFPIVYSLNNNVVINQEGVFVLEKNLQSGSLVYFDSPIESIEVVVSKTDDNSIKHAKVSLKDLYILNQKINLLNGRRTSCDNLTLLVVEDCSGSMDDKDRDRVERTMQEVEDYLLTREENYTINHISFSGDISLKNNENYFELRSNDVEKLKTNWSTAIKMVVNIPEKEKPDVILFLTDNLPNLIDKDEVSSVEAVVNTIRQYSKLQDSNIPVLIKSVNNPKLGELLNKMFYTDNIDFLKGFKYFVENKCSKESSNKLKIYPNPTSYALFVDKNELIEELPIIFDALGRSIQLKVKEFENNWYYNIEALSDGIYYVHTKTKNGIIIKSFFKESH